MLERFPEDRPADLVSARELAAGCRACPLWQGPTQTVFGEGPADARVMLVGEQPGDQEDRRGRPFVGPAGKVLDRALAEAGIDRAALYLTNAVKHFKFVPRGQFRLHKKPDASEIDTCRWWLDLERDRIRPGLIVAMGATAGRGLLGREVRIGRERGRLISLRDGETGLITVHPSYVLRIEEPAAQAEAFAGLVADLQRARPFLAGDDSPPNDEAPRQRRLDLMGERS